MDKQGWNLSDHFPSAPGKTLGEMLLEPTRIYVRSLLPLVQQGQIKGLAHITGGGLLENIPRVLPEDCHAIVDTGRWDLPAIFAHLQTGGHVAASEMARTFNCGIGMAVIVGPNDIDAATSALESAGETVHRIGHIDEGQRGCTVSGRAGSWNSNEDWSATHHA